MTSDPKRFSDREITDNNFVRFFTDPVLVHHILLADVVEHPLIHRCGEVSHDPGQIPGQIIEKKTHKIYGLRVHYLNSRK